MLLEFVEWNYPLFEKKKWDAKYITALPMDMLLASAFSFSVICQSLPQGLSNNDL